MVSIFDAAATYWSHVCELLVASMRTVGRKYATGPTQGCDARWVFNQRFPSARIDDEAIWDAVFATFLPAYRGVSGRIRDRAIQKSAENAPKATDSARVS
jgi:hypothetical protein